MRDRNNMRAAADGKKAIGKPAVKAAAAVLAFCLAFPTAVLAAPAASQQTAQSRKLSILSVEGEDAGLAKSGRPEVKVAAGMPLGQGQSLRTGEKTWLYLEADDDKVFQMGETTKIRISQASAKKLKVTVDQGSFYFNIKRPVAGGEEVSFESAQTSLSIRGTSGFIAADRNETRIYLLSGRAEGQVAGEPFSLEAGHMLQVEKNLWGEENGSHYVKPRETILEIRPFGPDELNQTVTANGLLQYNTGFSMTWEIYFGTLNKLREEALGSISYKRPVIDRDSSGRQVYLPSDGAERPSDGVDWPVDGIERPSDGTDWPVDGTERPSDGTDWPVDRTDQASNETGQQTEEALPLG